MYISIIQRKIIKFTLMYERMNIEESKSKSVLDMMEATDIIVKMLRVKLKIGLLQKERINKIRVPKSVNKNITKKIKIPRIARKIVREKRIKKTKEELLIERIKEKRLKSKEYLDFLERNI